MMLVRRLALFTLLAFAACVAAEPATQPAGTLLGSCANLQIAESSGIAISRTHPGCFWTHNDSGDSARLFLVGPKGEDRGVYKIEGAIAVDWEDICSFTLDKKNYLLIADVGDNAQLRKHGTLYLVEEPAADDQTHSIKVLRKIDVVWPGGAMNCESIAIDTATKTIFLTTKESAKKCKIYSLPLPTESSTKSIELSKVADVEIPTTSSMDISADGTRCIILCYPVAYEWVRGKNETWPEALARQPQTLTLPKRKQGEGICYGEDNLTLYLTSEGKPCPLWRVDRPKP